ncbi:MAG: ribbon-helix-helix domain-containing protein [Coriobacteriales bacterium]|jgi:RHH-type rel operon transcriptional repressor/antitoxin RelB|nr:ribbon-helix-helix domain-containing protein [Coriobacteriales bacterium]
MPTSIRLDKETEERLAQLSANTGRSRAFYLREAIESSLPRLEWEYDLLQRVHAVRSGKAETRSLSEVRADLDLGD